MMKWSRHKIELVRQAFNYAEADAARLLCFGELTRSVSVGGFVGKAKELSVSDLISFSINARRTIELCEAWALAKDELVHPWNLSPFPSGFDVGPKSFWEVINLVLHSRTLDVLISSEEFDAFYRGKTLQMETLVNRFINGGVLDCSPFVVVESDRKNSYAFNVLSLVRAFSRMIDPLSDVAERNGLELDPNYYSSP